jgi:peptidoglycan/LPS O-acetylase OafA/YrhL
MSLVGTHQVEWLRFGRALAVWPVGALKPNVVWSLRHEFLFYALFALTIMGVRRRTWLLGLWFVAPLALWPVLDAFGFALSVTPDWPTELMSVLLLGAWTGANLQFGAGFVLGVLVLRSHALVKPQRFAMVFTLLAVAAAALVVEVAALPIGLTRSIVWTVCAAPPVWLSLMVGARQPGWLGRLGILLGDASFAIYLTHNTVILLLFNASKHLHRLPPPIAFHAGLTVIALAAGIIVHRLVERPLIAWFTARIRRPGVAAAG